MKYAYVAALLSLAAVPTNADEYKKNQDPQIFEKSYEAMHHAERPYEIGKTSLQLSVDCLDNKEAVEKALGDKATAISAKVTEAAKALNLGEPSDTYGYDFEKKSVVKSETPIIFPHADNEYKWENRCTGEKSDKPVKVKKVFKGSKIVTFFFPNQEKVLNDLAALVTDIEKLSEEGTVGVKVECNTESGNNYDLDVSKKTADAVWKEIEGVAKSRANAKVAADFGKTKYDDAWKGTEGFLEDATTRLPGVKVTKEGSRWVAKFSDSRYYSVLVKQGSTAETGGGVLTDIRGYTVRAEAESTEGLYGTLNINVVHGCQENQEAAEKAAAAVGNEILAEMRALNQGKNAEGNRLNSKNAVGTEDTPWVKFKEVENPDQSYTRFYFNKCTGEVKSGPTTPEGKVWKGSMNLVISSSDLDGLVKLRDRAKARSKQEIADEAQPNVTVSEHFTATLAVLEDLGSKLETELMDKFLDDKGEFKCSSSGVVYACMSTGYNAYPQAAGARSFQEGSLTQESLQDAAVAAAPAYTQGITSDISSEERGVKEFNGKYFINYTLRKVLIKPPTAPVLP